MRINLHIYASPLDRDSRSYKQTTSLIQEGFFDKIYILGILKNELPSISFINDKIEINRLKIVFFKNVPFLKSLAFYIEWYIKVWQFAKNKNIDVIQCHSVYDLPIGVLLKLKKKCKLVYDAHELETERNGLKGISKIILKFLEKIFITYTDLVLVVSDSILKWYKKKYPKQNIELIRNLPLQESKLTANFFEKNYFQNKYNLKENDILFIYLGAFINGRGIDILLNCFEEIDKKFNIVFMGYGDYENRIIEYSKRNTNIHYHPPVETNKIISIAKSADVGISLIENTCLSYYFCLPNKLFEYISAGLPVISSDFPEMEAVINKHDCGWVTKPSVIELKRNIQKITKDLINNKKNNLKNIQIETWEVDEKKYISLYQQMIQKR